MAFPCAILYIYFFSKYKMAKAIKKGKYMLSELEYNMGKK